MATTRRRFLAATAASTTLITMPYVRGAHAAGKLTVALWDHWVPGANTASTKLIEEWAAKEKVEVQIDYITTQGNKLLLTEQAEALARTGHDIMTFRCWGPADHAKLLEPVDDIMEPLIKQNGAANATAMYLGKSEGHWSGVPATRGSNVKGPCSRIDLMKQHAGIDVQAMYPAGGQPRRRLDARCFPAGGAGLPQGGRAVRDRAWHDDGFSRQRRGDSSMLSVRQLVDAKGNPTVKTDAVRQALEYYTRLARFFPKDAPAWDDASNNKMAGFGQGRADPEPAERLGGRQARCTESGRAAVDARHAIRAKGPLHALHPVLLGHLVVRQEQVCSQEPADAPLPT